MAKHIWQKSFDFLPLIFLALLLGSPLVSKSASGSQVKCSSTEIDFNIARLKSLGRREIESFAKCGLPLIPLLITALREQDYDRAYQASEVLYLIGIEFGSEPPLLTVL